LLHELLEQAEESTLAEVQAVRRMPITAHELILIMRACMFQVAEAFQVPGGNVVAALLDVA
jgi:hypothetical protein